MIDHLINNHFNLQPLTEYKYAQLESVAVDIVDDVITLSMVACGPEKQISFTFETDHKEDIANLIASYSPAHSNWQRVGEAKTRVVCQEGNGEEEEWVMM